MTNIVKLEVWCLGITDASLIYTWFETTLSSSHTLVKNSLLNTITKFGNKDSNMYSYENMNIT